MHSHNLPFIGHIGTSRQDFSEFCRSPSWQFENRSLQRLFLLFEIPVKTKNVQSHTPFYRKYRQFSPGL